MEIKLIDYFDEVFHAQYQWHSIRGSSYSHELQYWIDMLAGPLLSIANHGGCGYVYERDDRYFSDVSDPILLQSRLLEWHTGLCNTVDAFCPTNEEEDKDFGYMQTTVAKMMTLIKRACQIEFERFTEEKQASP